MKQIVVGEEIVEILRKKFFGTPGWSAFINDYSVKVHSGAAGLVTRYYTQKGVRFQDVEFVDTHSLEGK